MTWMNSGCVFCEIRLLDRSQQAGFQVQMEALRQLRGLPNAPAAAGGA